MKFFRKIQKNFAILGISTNQPRINGKTLTMCLILGTGLISSAVFLIYEADSFQEYTNNLYITTALMVCFTYYLIMIFNMENYTKLIRNVRNYIEKSEWFERLLFMSLLIKRINFQNLSTAHRKPFSTTPIDLWKNSRQLCILSCQSFRPCLSYFQKQSHAISCTLLPMWEMMCSNCHCFIGKFGKFKWMFFGHTKPSLIFDCFLFPNFQPKVSIQLEKSTWIFRCYSLWIHDNDVWIHVCFVFVYIRLREFLFHCFSYAGS